MATIRTRGMVCGLAVVCLVFAAGCTVGPRYSGAPPVAANAVHAESFSRAAKAAATPSPAPADWWKALDDTQLTSLIETALAHSPEIRIARARLRQSRAGLTEKQRNLAPKSSLAAAYVHASLPSQTLGIGSLDVYSANFDATWEIDLFGGTRRAIEAAAAEAGAVEADLADAQVQLAAEVAQSYVQLRDEQQRIALVRESADLEDQVLTLTQQRRTRGVASELDVERIRTQVEDARTAIIPLEGQIAESLDQLAVLTGREPGALDQDLREPHPLPTLPASIAVGDPAALLQRRPDIRAAERRLASQNAQIGEHEADWFPKVTLLGDLGFSADNPAHLVRRENLTWLVVPTLQWNLIDFGRTKAKVEQARAGYEEAEARYEQTVLGALRDAEVGLSRYGHQRESVVSLRNVELSASHAAELTQQRYRAGTTAVLDWLDTERTRFAAQQNRISGEAQLIVYYIALQKSLGLGWSAPSN